MTTTPIIPRDPNKLDLSQFRGPVRRCPLCNIENKLAGRSCKNCLDRGFVAECLNCKTTGLQTSGTVWDGGRSEHRSTCGPCGGKGYFPVNRPADWKDEFTDSSTQTIDTTAPAV
jgi:DnaJ-class molecular chaperone